jgi:hypothetical protein
MLSLQPTGEETMKALAVAFFIAMILSTFVPVPASAGCPPGTRYDCVTTYNGKQSCGCR